MAAPSKAFTLIADSAIDPDSPETTGLITQFRDNDVHLEEWLGKNFVAAIDHDHDGVNSKKVSGANLVLIERKEIAADTTQVDFTGLAGEADEIYVLMGRIRSTISGASGVLFEPNALTANQSTIAVVSDGTTLSTASSSDMRIGTMNSANTPKMLSFQCYFFARRTIQTLTSKRQFISFAAFMPDSVQPNELQLQYGFWDDNTTIVTSIRIRMITNALGKGSSIALFKVLQT